MSYTPDCTRGDSNNDIAQFTLYLYCYVAATLRSFYAPCNCAWIMQMSLEPKQCLRHGVEAVMFWEWPMGDAQT